jgi:heavy metal sensor kinase
LKFVEVWSPEGRLLYRSAHLNSQQLGGPPRPDMERTSVTSFVLQTGVPLRMRSGIRDVASGSRVLIHVASSEERFRHEWNELLAGLALGLPLALGIAGAGGYWLAGRALAPLGRMARQAERITADNLQERLPVESPDDELGHLARVFNKSLERLEESFGQLRRFTADASHELRTPLTAIRSVGEVALQADQEPARYREVIGSMLEEVDRVARLVDSLLFLSRADAGRALRPQVHSLLDVAQASAALLEILAEEKSQKLDVTGDSTVFANVDALVLRQAVVNLIDNAVKFSPSGTPIRVEVRRDGAQGVIDVADRGPGIPEAHRSRVFERFYRVDAARSREDGGAGLGLSIARWAVEAHGGRIEIVSREGQGSVFRILLPAVER